jgi:type II secretory pathway component GspD/PulD (secretin)
MTACIATAVILTAASASTQQTETPTSQIDAVKLEKRLEEIERQLATLLNEVQQLRRELHIQPAAPKVTVFPLKELDANSASRLLSDIFAATALTDFRGNKHPVVVIQADSATNSVIVVSTQEKIDAIKEILDKLDSKTK